jgi:O-succinylhomoserine sulfhydrylase
MIPYEVVKKIDLDLGHAAPKLAAPGKHRVLPDEPEDGCGFSTLAIRSGHGRSAEGEHSEPIHETSSYVYADCAESAAVFSGAVEGNVYSRFTNPTVRIFEERLAALECADAAIGAASGMAALLSAFITFLSAGDHVICSRAVFGSTAVLLRNFIAKFGVEISFVSQTDVSEWANAIRPNTRLMFCETPSNPTLDLVNISQLARLAKAAGAHLLVDNTFCTPVGQRPLLFGADMVMHSTSKYIDGQGRCIGGALAGRRELIDKVRTFMRCAGPAMTAHNAWIFLKGLETLEIRLREHSKNALELAKWLTYHPSVERVFYSGLPSHPQFELASIQQRYHGGVLSFQIKGGRPEAWKCIDAMKFISLTTNVGDTKSMVTHPASTTHVRLSPEERAAVGISEGLIRISVGLEDVEDIVKDVDHGLKAM